MKLKRRLMSRKGFSLAETLLAILIMLLVSVLLANGIPIAKNVFEKVTVGANARVMLSTAISALRNELGTAKNIKVSNDGKSVTYYSTEIGAPSKIYLADEAPHPIMIEEYVDPKYNADQTKGRELVIMADAVTSNGLVVTYDDIIINPVAGSEGKNIAFRGLKVKRKRKSDDRIFAYVGKTETDTENAVSIKIALGPVTEEKDVTAPGTETDP